MDGFCVGATARFHDYLDIFRQRLSLSNGVSHRLEALYVQRRVDFVRRLTNTQDTTIFCNTCAVITEK
jgi:hypothetical protein